ncbi:MAG TPA: hypothetical protein VM198_07855 [Longimicrobiales bacterium]|nr:hypothetical protein [Longimicrobiales bacterium]
MPLPDGSGSGRVVAVVASEGSVAAGWAASAALDIARAWSAGGARVIVADGALHYPTLHVHAQVDNGEGLSDAALFGVSVGRVARPVDDGSFFLITAGTAVANANAVPSSPRWSRLLEGFVEAGVRLLLFVRDGDTGCAAFLGSASDIVVLAARDEKAPSAVRDLEGLVRAVTGPGAPAEARTARGPAPPAARRSGLRPPDEWTAKDPAGRQRVVLLVIAVVVLIAALVMFFTSIDLSSLAPEESGAAPPPAAEALTGVA